MIDMMQGTKETRPAHALVDGAYIRIGSWGPLKGECKLIESYKQEGGLCGPYTIDYIPGGMWKVFRNDVFMRYADAGQVKEMAHHVALENGHLFEAMVEATEAEQPDRGDYGPQPAACKWVEEHDEVLVSYIGSDENWPTGCWQIIHDSGEQFVSEKQLLAIAKRLGMARQPDKLEGAFGASPKSLTMRNGSRIALGGADDREKWRGADDISDAFGIGPDEESYHELDDAFTGPATDERGDLEDAFG